MVFFDLLLFSYLLLLFIHYPSYEQSYIVIRRLQTCLSCLLLPFLFLLINAPNQIQLLNYFYKPSNTKRSWIRFKGTMFLIILSVRKKGLRGPTVLSLRINPLVTQIHPRVVVPFHSFVLRSCGHSVFNLVENILRPHFPPIVRTSSNLSQFNLEGELSVQCSPHLRPSFHTRVSDFSLTIQVKTGCRSHYSIPRCLILGNRSIYGTLSGDLMKILVCVTSLNSSRGYYFFSTYFHSPSSC